MSREFRHIVRIADTDLDGTKKVAYALKGIKGVGIRLAEVIAKKAGVDINTRLGFLTEAEVKRLEDVVRNPAKYGIPHWMFNRQKDLQTGEDLHLLGSDLELQIKEDIERMKRIKCWKGYRHAYGLKVRGQRTRTTGRTKKKLVVKKKKRRTS